GEHDPLERRDVGEAKAELAEADLGGLAGLVLDQRLAHAQDRTQPIEQRCLYLAIDHLVGLTEDVASLGVAENNIIDEADEHRRADLASKGALRLVVHVLRTETQRAVDQALMQSGQRDERRTDDAVYPGHAFEVG